MKDNHLKHGVSSRKPLLHDTLQKLLSNKLLLFSLQLNIDGLKHLLDFSVFLVHDSFKQSGDGGSDELAESTLEGSSLVGRSPHLSASVEVPITPKLLHHFVFGDAELVSIVTGEALKGESPLVKTRTERNSSLGGVDLDISEGRIVVCGDNDVHGFDGTAERLIKFFSGKLQLKESAIDLVDHENRLDTLTDGLTEDGFGLHADTVDGIDNHQSTIGHTKSGRNFGREINVTGRIDKVDKVGVLGDLHGGIRGSLGGNVSITGFLLFLGHEVTSLHVVLKKHGDSRGLDGDTTFGFIRSSVRVTSTTGSLGGNDAGLLNERIGQSGLSVIHVGNHTHGADIVLEVHIGPHLLYSKVNLEERRVRLESKREKGKKGTEKLVNGKPGILRVFLRIKEGRSSQVPSIRSIGPRKAWTRRIGP